MNDLNQNIMPFKITLKQKIKDANGLPYLII